MSEKIKQDISIGKNLHRLRKQAGLSQEQVAEIGRASCRERV